MLHTLQDTVAFAGGASGADPEVDRRRVREAAVRVYAGVLFGTHHHRTAALLNREGARMVVDARRELLGPSPPGGWLARVVVELKSLSHATEQRIAVFENRAEVVADDLVPGRHLRRLGEQLMCADNDQERTRLQAEIDRAVGLVQRLAESTPLQLRRMGEEAMSTPVTSTYVTYGTRVLVGRTKSTTMLARVLMAEDGVLPEGELIQATIPSGTMGIVVNLRPFTTRDVLGRLQDIQGGEASVECVHVVVDVLVKVLQPGLEPGTGPKELLVVVPVFPTAEDEAERDEETEEGGVQRQDPVTAPGKTIRTMEWSHQNAQGAFGRSLDFAQGMELQSRVQGGALVDLLSPLSTTVPWEKVAKVPAFTANAAYVLCLFDMAAEYARGTLLMACGRFREEMFRTALKSSAWITPAAAAPLQDVLEPLTEAAAATILEEVGFMDSRPSDPDETLRGVLRRMRERVAEDISRRDAQRIQRALVEVITSVAASAGRGRHRSADEDTRHLDVEDVDKDRLAAELVGLMAANAARTDGMATREWSADAVRTLAIVRTEGFRDGSHEQARLSHAQTVVLLTVLCGANVQVLGLEGCGKSTIAALLEHLRRREGAPHTVVKLAVTNSAAERWSERERDVRLDRAAYDVVPERPDAPAAAPGTFHRVLSQDVVHAVGETRKAVAATGFEQRVTSTHLRRRRWDAVVALLHCSSDRTDDDFVGRVRRCLTPAALVRAYGSLDADLRDALEAHRQRVVQCRSRLQQAHRRRSTFVDRVFVDEHGRVSAMLARAVDVVRAPGQRPQLVHFMDLHQLAPIGDPSVSVLTAMPAVATADFFGEMEAVYRLHHRHRQASGGSWAACLDTLRKGLRPEGWGEPRLPPGELLQ